MRAAAGILKWTQLSRGVDWPSDEERFENYHADPLLGIRVRSVFEEARWGFMLVETVGGVTESDQPSRAASTKVLVKDLGVERREGVVEGKKQAPQMPALHVTKPEKAVGDQAALAFKHDYICIFSRSWWLCGRGFVRVNRLGLFRSRWSWESLGCSLICGRLR
jgi:ATP-dependent RNA circularization protein (DNA/RNA ligase family)